jgi:hypothetical protein
MTLASSNGCRTWPAAVFHAALFSGPVYQDAANGLGGGGKEMTAAFFGEKLRRNSPLIAEAEKDNPGQSTPNRRP